MLRWILRRSFKILIKQERVADTIYSFQSDVYAQVNAGVIVGQDMAIVIDTLALPTETIHMRNFIEQDLQIPIRYVINTHYHADHAWGNYLFPQAKIIAHKLCYQKLKKSGISSLRNAKRENSAFRNSKILLPQITFDQGEITLKIGKKTVKIFPLPGHTDDSIAVFVVEDRVLFSGDTMMPLPFIVDGDMEDTIESLKVIGKMPLENIVQGHGDIILRGEVAGLVKNNLDYLAEINRVVKKAARRKYPLDLIEAVDIESCDKSRVLLGGLAEQLHQQNMLHLYKKLTGESPLGSEEYFVGD